MRGRKSADAERAIGDEAGIDPSGIGEGGQEERIGPQCEARGDPGHGAARGAALPQEAAEEDGCELGDRGEGNEADLGECGASMPIIR